VVVHQQMENSVVVQRVLCPATFKSKEMNSCILLEMFYVYGKYYGYQR